jgi:uncharacterized BrkB/YihY/UPF0761 family membrane protein
VHLTVNAVGGYSSLQIFELFRQSYDSSQNVIVFDAGTNDNPNYPEILAGRLQAVGQESVDLFGRAWSLHGLSGVLLYLLGFAGEIFVLTSVYLVMPAGRLRMRHALIGGVTAAVLWEITRHVLVWYFATLSQVNVVYGSLTTAIVVLLSLEIAATLLLLGAQVISEYERIGVADSSRPPADFRTA